MHQPPLAAGLAVTFLTPMLGVVAYLFLCHRMLRSRIEMPPLFSYFILFAIYGAWLVVVLTALFWVWSGMASLGLVSLLLFAPLVTLVLALLLRKRRHLSAYHRVACILSTLYTVAIPGLVLSWIVIAVFYRR